MTALTTLYNWFSDLKKPTGAQFRALIDSFWHKGEKIPMAGIEGLSTLIEGTASASQLKSHLEDSQAHKELLDKKVDKVAGKKLSTEDFTTELRRKLESLRQVDVSLLLPRGNFTGTAQDLKDLIDSLTRIMQSPDTELDELREIVAYIKQNKHILSTLGINNIAGLEDALAAKADKDHNHDERYAAKKHTHSEYAHRTHRHNWDDIDGKPNNLATTDNVKAAVDGIQIGGRNLLKKSGKVVTGEEYLLATYQVTEDINLNEKISLSVEGDFAQGCYPMLFASGGDGNYGVIQLGANVWNNKMGKKITKNQDLYLFIIGNDNGNKINTIRRIKLEKGDKVTDWTPAPEDILDSTINIGGRNLLRGTADFEIYEFPYYLQPNYVGMGVVVPETFRGNKVVKLTSNWQGFQCRTTFEDLPMIISFWAKTTRPNIVLRCVTDEGVEYVNGGSLIPDGGWHKYVVRKNGRITTSNSGRQGFVEFCCITEGKHIEEVFVSSFKIEYGNIASDWSPAPEDESLFRGEINIDNLNDEINRNTGVYTVIDPGTGSYMLLSFKGTGSTSQLEIYKPNWHEHTRLQVRSRIDGGRYSGSFKDIAWFDDIIRRSLVLDGGQLNQIEHSNSVIFVRSGGDFDLSLLEDCTSCSFRKVFDGDAVTFSCVGKSIIYTGDTQFNGKRGSTAVVSVYNNECYIDIRNV